MQIPTNKYLFNFSSSYTGGGLQILNSYLDFFNKNGGAYFVLNSRLKGKLSQEYPKNKIFFVKISKIRRLLNDTYYLSPVLKNLPALDLYFSYGIPVYKRLARNNWFHVSNMIPVNPQKNYLGMFHMLQMKILGSRIKRYAKNASYLSADSQDALNKSSDFLGHSIKNKVVLRNGVDGNFIKLRGKQKHRNAVTIGTQPYKDLDRLYRLYLWLKQQGEVQSLIIIGATNTIPKRLLKDSSVVAMGVVEPDQVYEELAQASTYITTSLIENSSVAALEGLYLCSSSYLSQIGSHKEMLEDAQLDYENIEVDGAGSFYKSTLEVSPGYIESISWDSVNQEFFEYLQKNLS